MQGVSIVIPNYNGKHLLERFLPSVLAASEAHGGENEILVIDDTSTDGSIGYLEGVKGVRVVRRRGARGFGRTCNEGARAARNNILVFLNNDVEVTRGFIPPLVGHFDDREVFAVTCKSFNLPGMTFRDGGKIYEFRKGFFKVHRNYDIEDSRREVVNTGTLLSFVFCAALSAVRRDMYLELGGFDEMFSPFNWEDADLSYRALKRGWTIHYEPRSVVYHQGNVTINSHYRKLSVLLISKRNRLFMMWKNLTDTKFLVKHILYLVLWLILYAGVLNVVEVGAFFMALYRLPYVLKERKKYGLFRKRSDGEIQHMFASFMAQRGVVVKN